MADQLFEEYKEYYKVRAQRFAGNKNYAYSFEAETNLANALLSCNELSEFKQKIGKLNHKCASALIMDKYIMSQAFFNEMKEVVRVLAGDRILQKAMSYKNVMDLISMVTEEENKGMIEVSMDESNRQFHYDWFLLDNIEIYENAEVPDSYKKEFMDYAQEVRASIQENVKSIEENNSHWQEGWKLNPDVVVEHRHRRLLPYKDEHVMEQLKKYKSITNR